MSENKEIQKMYEYQEKKGNSGYEYVVRGAEVFCGYGSKTCALELPKDHGVYTSDGRPLITVNDSKIKNIRGFGTCNINRRKPCTCEPKLGTWSVVSNKDMKIKDNNTKKEAFAVERNSTAICLKGGIIAFSTSGQASPSFNQLKVKEAVEIVENVKGRWNNTDYNKDFLGNIKINNAGLYNFGISFYNNKTVKKPGSIFVYENGGGKYKFIGAYEIKDHTGNEQNKFPEDTIRADSSNQSMYTYSTYYWKYWADIVLKAGKEYYFEIDCPSREAFDYKLIGNQEIIVSENIELAVWKEADMCTNWYRENTGGIVLKQHMVYIHKPYIKIFYDYLAIVQLNQSIENENNDSMSSTVKTVAETLMGLWNTTTGVAATGADILFGFISVSEIKELSKQLYPYVNGDKQNVEMIKILMKGYPEALKTHNIDAEVVTEVSEYSEINKVVGGKYHWGNFCGVQYNQGKGDQIIDREAAEKFINDKIIGNANN